MNNNREIIKLLVQIELARRNFYYFCRLKDSEFYKKDRTYLKTLCDELQAFCESEDDVLIINMPPRMGKSYTLQNLETWLLGLNYKEKIITASYNRTLSNNFSKGVRNSIQEVKVDKDRIVYSDIFNTKIKKGSGASEMWSVEGSPLVNFLSTSPSSTVTGFGCSYMVIDDLIKNAEESANETLLEKHFKWLTDTMLSRIEIGGKLIVIFTRWSNKDLAGRLLDFYKEQGMKIRHVLMRAEQEDGSSLCEELLPLSRIKFLKSIMSEAIFNANYNQIPMDVKGRLYTDLRTYNYDELYEIEEKYFDNENSKHNVYTFKKDKNNKRIYKFNFDKVITYTDTADEGTDYLCSITAGIYKRKIYVLDVIYTKAHMESTEPMVAKSLKDYEVHLCRIESNNGGKGFARNVDRLSKELKNNITQITTFTQTKNKASRIYSNKDNVMMNIYFPENWSVLWPEFFKSMVEYQAEGKNKNDDAEDSITGIYETFQGLGYYDY